MDKILEFGQPVDPTIDKGRVKETFFEDHMDQGVVEGQIGARADHPVAMGLGGRDRDAGVDIGHAASVFQGIHEVVDLFDRDGFKDVAAV